MKLSYNIVIPVLNEEKRIVACIPKIRGLLLGNGFSRFSITIADNGSTDQTEKISKDLAAQYGDVNYVKVGKKGVGLALKTAWDQSSSDVIGYMDVDLATDISHFMEVAAILEKGGIQVVNGSRNLHGSRVINRSVVRTVTSRGFNFLLRGILNTKITDGMCGFKFLRRDAYQKLREVGLFNDGWFFCTELLCVAERVGMHIQELPVSWYDDRDSRVRITQTAIYYLKEIFKLRSRRIHRDYK